MVEVDLAACDQLVELLRQCDIPPDREESSLPGFSPDQTGNYFLLLVAICHQTSPRGMPPLEGVRAGRYRKGWDYLRDRLESEALANPRLLQPPYWTSVTGEQVRLLFRDPENGDRLTDPDGRAALIRDLGETMNRNGWDSLQQLYATVGGRVSRLLSLLSQFRAYRDPVRKKSLFLLSLMRNSGIWEYSDPENLGPPVDYHEVRGHLRLGTVRLVDPGLDARVLAGEEVTGEEDVAIRQAVYEAILRIARGLGVTPSQMHYLFWYVFRSCCTVERPHCDGCPAGCKLIDRYAHLGAEGASRRCPFRPVCPSASLVRRYAEHHHVTDFY